MAEKVFGIDFSVAARLVENAFRKELGFDDDDIKNLNGNDKLERHCLEDTLEAVTECIRTNGQRGLPSLKPSRSISFDVIKSVTLKNTIAELADVVGVNAYFER
jgi:hypothetical protein